ncbi:MAG: FMN-dependent NADH-azoreductase [Alphaproteobacteria bacterium]
MTNLLLVISSPRNGASLSSKVARELVDKLLAAHPGATLTVRDLAAEPLPHIGDDYVAGRNLPADQRSPAQAEAVAIADRLTEELQAADVVVLASAMINFGISSTLKSWFDYLLRAGITFSYGADGAKGLVTGKKAYLVAARGGIYSEGPTKAIDFQEPYVRHLLGFMGITDVETVLVEGAALGPEAAERSLTTALDHVAEITAQAA